MHLRRSFLLSLPIAVLASSARAQAPDLSGLSPARNAVVAEAHGLKVVMLFSSTTSAQLVVYRGATEEAKSPLFEFPTESNHGAVWVEHVRVLSPSMFLVAVRTRQNCGPESHDYTFSRLNADWVLTRLFREDRECLESGSVPAWRTTYDYIAGTARTTKFHKARPQKTHVIRKPLKQTRLPDFYAFDPRHESDA